MHPRSTRLIITLGILTCLAALAGCSPTAAPGIATIRTDLQTNFANCGWNVDRYNELPPLDANKSMLVADLKGPGIIRHIHFTRHSPEDRASRGVVLEIWFDDATEPAVHCPIADFFGDGCNGQSIDFSTPLIECAPWSYNAYFAMPFKTRARVLLRNDLDKNLLDYGYVEWENLPQWDDSLGYFHATYARRCFPLTKDTDQVFFEVRGTGHVLGRQFSVVTDEPLFKGFHMVMEGNNEIDIDGRPRQVDYLGSEDSFTFSWGFQKTFAGLHAGMTLVKPDVPCMVSMYRFHDHQPIRFNKSLRWHINWAQEKHMFRNTNYNAKWDEALAKGGAMVDYATVYYWYQSVPGGYQHQPLPPPAERAKLMAKPETQPS